MVILWLAAWQSNRVKMNLILDAAKGGCNDLGVTIIKNSTHTCCLAVTCSTQAHSIHHKKDCTIFKGWQNKFYQNIRQYHY